MKYILDKISSYNLFNNLVPGLSYLYLSDKILNTCFFNDSLIEIIIIAYLVGMIISRFSSIVITNIIFKVSNIKEAKYKDYITACDKDEKINVLLQDRNIYRSLCGMGVILLFLKLVQILLGNNLNYNIILEIIFLIVFIIIFAISFVKQNKFIINRIKTANKK